MKTPICECWTICKEKPFITLSIEPHKPVMSDGPNSFVHWFPTVQKETYNILLCGVLAHHKDGGLTTYHRWVSEEFGLASFHGTPKVTCQECLKINPKTQYFSEDIDPNRVHWLSPANADKTSMHAIYLCGKPYLNENSRKEHWKIYRESSSTCACLNDHKEVTCRDCLYYITCGGEVD